MNAIAQRKNSISINGSEYPVDQDLSFERVDRNVGIWKTQAKRGFFDFQLDKPQEVFTNYQSAFTRSTAFSQKSFLRELFWRKEEGVKIVAGHGVFILPSNMVLTQYKSGKIAIKVFAGTRLNKSFSNPNSRVLVAEAKEYYDEHFEEVRSIINHDLYKAVENHSDFERSIGGLVIPKGVVVFKKGSGYQVNLAQYPNQKYVGVAKTTADIGILLDKAELMRQDALEQKADQRRVTAQVLSFSEYIRRI